MANIFKLVAAVMPAATVAAAGAGPAFSHQPAVAADAVAIPFNPPLNQAVAYRYTRSDTRNGQPRETSIDLNVEFRGGAEGYLMTVRHVIPAAMERDPAAVLLTRPLVLRVDQEGAILGLEDEAGYWRDVETLLSETARGSADPVGAARVMESMLTRMRGLPDIERLALLTRNVSPILEFAGRLLPKGGIRESNQRESVLGSLTQTLDVTWTRDDAEYLRILVVATIPPDQLTRGIGGFVQDLVPHRAGEVGRVTNFEERTDYRVSMMTGLTEEWTTQRTLVSDSEDGSETIRSGQSLTRIIVR